MRSPRQAIQDPLDPRVATRGIQEVALVFLKKQCYPSAHLLAFGLPSRDVPEAALDEFLNTITDKSSDLHQRDLGKLQPGQGQIHGTSDIHFRVNERSIEIEK